MSVTPEQKDAIKRAERILADAGLDYVLTDREHLDEELEAHRRLAAKGMQGRAIAGARNADQHPAYSISPHAAVVAVIAALPLLDEA